MSHTQDESWVTSPSPHPFIFLTKFVPVFPSFDHSYSDYKIAYNCTVAVISTDIIARYDLCCWLGDKNNNDNNNNKKADYLLTYHLTDWHECSNTVRSVLYFSQHCTWRMNRSVSNSVWFVWLQGCGFFFFGTRLTVTISQGGGGEERNWNCRYRKRDCLLVLKLQLNPFPWKRTVNFFFFWPLKVLFLTHEIPLFPMIGPIQVFIYC